MDFEDNVIWSENSFSVKEVIVSCAKFDFPVLVKVTRGFYGIKEDDTIDTDQVLVFYECGKENCVLVRNEDGCCLSIPVNHNHRFNVISGGKAKKDADAQPLKRILKHCKLPVKIRFDEKMYTSFTVSDKLRNSEEYGEMVVESTHQVDYIIASPVDEGELHKDHVIYLPIYRDVRFMIAENGDAIMQQFFKGAEKEKHNTPSDVSLSIVGYEDLGGSDSEYDTFSIRPTIDSEEPKRLKQNKVVGALGESDIYDTVIPSRTLGSADGRSWSAEAGARRHQSLKGHPVKGISAGNGRSVSCSSMAVYPRRQAPPPVPPHATPPMLRPKPSPQKVVPLSSSANSPSSSGPKSPTSATFSCFQEIPNDITQMTIGEVCSCLRLLKLEQFAHNFVDNQVDGRLLMEYSLDDLKLLGLNQLQAKKLEMFAKKNWRPME